MLPLPPGPWVDVLTGVTHAGGALLSSLTKRFPVALLVPGRRLRADPAQARRRIPEGRRDRLQRLGAAAGRVEVQAPGDWYPMSPAAAPGWWEADVGHAPGGTDYAFRLDGGAPLPDPRSPRQPYGPHGGEPDLRPLRLRLGATRGWRGAPLRGAVIYELHVGTFTPAGTLDAAIERLDHLRDLGVTVVELMPVAAFPGQHGWGYDGIGLWAVHEPYGGPDALKRFVDACPRPRARRLPRRRVQPRRPGQPARRVRAVLHRRAHDPVGPGGQPGPARLR